MKEQHVKEGELEKLAKDYATMQYPIKTEDEYYRDDVDEPYYDYVTEAFVIKVLIMNSFKAGYAAATPVDGEKYKYEIDIKGEGDYYQCDKKEYDTFPGYKRRIPITTPTPVKATESNEAGERK